MGRYAGSRNLSITLRQLCKEQVTIQALVAYSDPMAGHTGVIYQASGFLYLGKSTVMPLYKLADRGVHHSRSFSQRNGTQSRKYFQSHGVSVEVVEQALKHNYVALIEPLPEPVWGLDAHKNSGAKSIGRPTRGRMARLESRGGATRRRKGGSPDYSGGLSGCHTKARRSVHRLVPRSL